MSGGGQSMCQEIDAIRQREQTSRQQTGDIVSTFQPVKQMLGDCGIGACNKSDNSTINNIRQNFKAIQDVMVSNKCDNISTIVQENIDAQPPICTEMIFRNCQNPFTGESNIECLKIARDILKDRQRLKMANRNNVSNICEINAAMQVIASQEATAENAAFLQTMQEAKNFLTNNKSEGFNCNEINQNITSEQYLKVLLKCFQESAVRQGNYLTGCHPIVTEMTNDNNEIKSCLLSAGILMKSSQAGSLSNQSAIKTGQIADTMASLTSSAASLPIIIMCCILIIGSIFILPMLGGNSGEAADLSSTFSRVNSIGRRF